MRHLRLIYFILPFVLLCVNNNLLAQDIKIKVSFSANVKSVNSQDYQKHQLRVKISTDFSGKYIPAEVNNATWYDITGRFSLTDSKEYHSAGIADISDLVIPNKPLFFAFQYIDKKNSVNGKWRVWRVKGFSLKVNKTVVASQTTAGWKPVGIGNWQSGRGAAIYGSSLAFNGNAHNENETDKEGWVISRPLYLLQK